MAANNTHVFEHKILRPVPPLIPGISDFHLLLLVPVIVFWLTSAVFEICERIDSLEQYRIHTSEEELAKNHVTRWECLCGTLQGQIQVLQTFLGLALGMLGGEEVDLMGNEDYELAVWINRVQTMFATIPSLLNITGINFKAVGSAISTSWPLSLITEATIFDSSRVEILLGKMLYWYMFPMFQLFSALVVADGCMYAIHRLGHTNKWIYKHFHSQHHRLYVPYSWGAGYNHPFDSLITDGLSFSIGCWAANLTIRQSMIFFTYATVKNGADHCGYIFPWNPIRSITGIDASYHDVHHQSWGLKTNYGIHFTIWDRMFGTYFGDEQEIARLRARNRIAAKGALARKGL